MRLPRNSAEGKRALLPPSGCPDLALVPQVHQPRQSLMGCHINVTSARTKVGHLILAALWEGSGLHSIAAWRRIGLAHSLM